MMLKIFMPLKDPASLSRMRHSYIVQPDDSIASIARRHDMTEMELRGLNKMKPSDVIAPGQVLQVLLKKRSQSLPKVRLPHMQRNSDPENNHVEDDEQPEISPQRRSQDGEKRHWWSRRTHHAQPEADDTYSPVPRTRKQRSQSEHKVEVLTMRKEKEEQLLPTLIGGTSTEVLSNKRLGPSLVPQIENCLPMHIQGYDWKLLYSLMQHGSSLDTLMRKVRNQSPTLIVVETAKGEVFGGYAAVPWKNSASYYGIGESFVFTCQPSFERFGWKRTNSLYMFSSVDCIAMGGGRGFAWFLNSDLSRGTTGECDTFMNRPLTSESDFDVVSVEVWGFVYK